MRPGGPCRGFVGLAHPGVLVLPRDAHLSAQICRADVQDVDPIYRRDRVSISDRLRSFEHRYQQGLYVEISVDLSL